MESIASEAESLPPSQSPYRIGVIALLVFVSVGALLLFTHGNRLVLNNDEGVILDAAARMLHGQTVYRDFFGYMSPGSYWIQEAAYGLLGISILSGRVVVILDFALQCAVVFWLSAVLAGRGTASAATLLFVVFQATTPDFLLAQHRMDSAALALLSIALCVEGRRRARHWYWGAAGLLTAAATVCTPSVGLIGVVTLTWLITQHRVRRFLISYAGGLCAGGLAIGFVLVVTGMLGPLIDQMNWLRRNYSTVNYMPYGSIIGGYANVLKGHTGIALGVRSLLLLCTALPAVLPVIAIAGWTVSWLSRKRRPAPELEAPVYYLAACMLAFIVSTYPRADVAHLAFVAALPYVLAFAWMSQYAPRPAAFGAFLMLALGGTLFVAQTAKDILAEVPVVTPIGTGRIAAADEAGVRELLQAVRPGSLLYVHPYRPMLYVLTQARNPTRYSYLAPGMMTTRDETAALTDLRKTPPRAIAYLPLERSEYLRVFPNASRLDHRFRQIEEWITQKYLVMEPPVWIAGYRLLAVRGATQ